MLLGEAGPSGRFAAAEVAELDWQRGSGLLHRSVQLPESIKRLTSTGGNCITAMKPRCFVACGYCLEKTAASMFSRRRLTVASPP